MASNYAANTAPNRVPGRRFDSFEEKGHRALRELRLATLAKLIKREADFVSNHGTMPPLGGGVVEFEANRLAKLEKTASQK
jgi:hypothetical protein